MARCNARYSEQVRCEEAAGHLEEQRPHFHSFFMRSWEDDRPFVPVWRRRAIAGQGVGKDLTGTVAS